MPRHAIRSLAAVAALPCLTCAVLSAPFVESRLRSVRVTPSLMLPPLVRHRRLLPPRLVPPPPPTSAGAAASSHLGSPPLQAHLPEVPDGYELSIGAENFLRILDTWGGPTARADWDKLAAELRPLSKGVMALPSTAVRGDLGVLATLGLRYPRAFIDVVWRRLEQTASPSDDHSIVHDVLLDELAIVHAVLLRHWLMCRWPTRRRSSRHLTSRHTAWRTRF